MLGAALAVTFASFAGLVSGKALSGYPHDYRGKPTGNYSESAKWQDYYEVHTARLPNVSFPLPRSFAGNIPVDRPNHPNNTLFFWGFERQNGSMTAKAGQRQDEPWGIWLNGGPGSSSLQGLLYENGPIHLNAKLHPVANKYSWNRLADFIWLDQPVGTGYSTCDENGFATNETQVADDFIGFLKNLVQVFPSLKTRPLYLTGESYAGTYIPYMTRALLSMSDPPVQLRKISIGDGAIGEKPQYITAYFPSWKHIQLIDYDVDVYNWFKQQHTLCGYNLNLTYPQTGGTFPTFDNPPKVGNNHKVTYVPKNLPSHRRAYFEDHDTELDEKRELFEEWLESTPANPIVNERDWMAGAASISFSKRALNIPWKRNLAGRANGTIDPYYTCNLFDELIDYALNFSKPWFNHTRLTGIDPNDVPNALFPRPMLNSRPYLNNNKTRHAIHAPWSKPWQSARNYTWGGNGGVANRDPSIKPMSFLSQLATQMQAQGVGAVIYSGNDGLITPHLTSQAVIQNTTFGGVQGFTKKPSTPWYDDDGLFAGIVHQERNWTYILVKGGGHRLPMNQPERAYVILREFILGHNKTGTIANGTLVGGTDPSVADILRGQEPIYQGANVTQSTYTFPYATVSAWNQTFGYPIANYSDWTKVPAPTSTSHHRAHAHSSLDHTTHTSHSTRHTTHTSHSTRSTGV